MTDSQPGTPDPSGKRFAEDGQFELHLNKLQLDLEARAQSRLRYAVVCLVAFVVLVTGSLFLARFSDEKAGLSAFVLGRVGTIALLLWLAYVALVWGKLHVQHMFRDRERSSRVIFARLQLAEGQRTEAMEVLSEVTLLPAEGRE